MSVKFHIEVDGAAETYAAFGKVERGVLDLRQLGTWDWVQSIYYKVLKEQFASEGGSGASGTWKPLSSPYKERKQKLYGDMPILQATGKMYRSLTGEGGDAVVDKQPLEMTLGSRDPKSAYHNRGGGRLPQRKILDFTPDQVKQIMKPIQTKLEQLIDNAKLRDIRGF